MTADRSPLTWCGGNDPITYPPGIQVSHRLFYAPHPQSPDMSVRPSTLGPFHIPSKFPRRMLEVIHQHHANRLYGIRSPAAKIKI
jgi:hypothetical protein